MGNKVFKHIRVTGVSDDSYQEAIEAAIDKAGDSVHNLSWFEVKELRGAIVDGKPSAWQATVELGFKVD